MSKINQYVEVEGLNTSDPIQGPTVTFHNKQIADLVEREGLEEATTMISGIMFNPKFIAERLQEAHSHYYKS